MINNPFLNRFLPRTTKLVDQQPDKFGAGLFNADDPNNTAPDFASRYQDIIKRNAGSSQALRDLVTQGPPNPEPTKWNKVGAILSGLSSGWLEGPSAGYQATTQALDRPRELAQKDYNTKVKNLGDLAGLDEQQMQDQLKALEFDREDYYKNQDLQLNKKREDREGKATQSEIDARNAEMEDKNWMHYIDKETGNEMRFNTKTKEHQVIGKVADTSEEETKDAAAKATAIAGAQEPFNINKEARDKAARLEEIGATTKGQLKVEEARAKAQKEIQGMKDTASKDRLNTRLDGTLGKNPNQAAKQAVNEIKAATSNDTELQQNPDKYFDDPAQDGTIRIKPDGYFDSDEVKAKKQELRNIVGNAYKKAAETGKTNNTGKGGGPGTVSTPPPPGFTVRPPR